MAADAGAVPRPARATRADSLGVGARISGGHEGVLQQLALIAAAVLLGVSPWARSIAARFDLVPVRGQSAARGADGGAPGPLQRARSPVTGAGVATIIAALTAGIAALVVIINGLASAPASGLALVIAGGAAVLVVTVRVLMLVRENGVALRMWREAGGSLRDLASRTSDMVMICDLDGTISYASPRDGFSYPPDAFMGRRLSEFVHPEDIAVARAAVAAGSACRGRGADAAAAASAAAGTAATRPTARTAPTRRAGSPAGYGRPTAPGGTSRAPSCSTRCPASRPGCWSRRGTSPTRSRCAIRWPT